MPRASGDENSLRHVRWQPSAIASNRHWFRSLLCARPSPLNVDIGNNVVIRNNNVLVLPSIRARTASVAHAGRHNTIHSRRRAAALDVTEDRYTGVSMPVAS